MDHLIIAASMLIVFYTILIVYTIIRTIMFIYNKESSWFEYVFENHFGYIFGGFTALMTMVSLLVLAVAFVQSIIT